MTDPIVKTIEVPCSAARAFEVFVHKIAAWWPLDRHSVSAGAGQAARSVTIEPHVGGAVYEVMADGARAEWGRVLVFDDGVGLRMTWHPGNPVDKATQLDLRFVEQAPDRTLVTLTHSGWTVWGDEARDKHQNYTHGWDVVLSPYLAVFK